MTTTSSTPDVLDYDEAVAAFDPVLGLEVHVELNTATKMFCGCPTEFGAEPNTQTCPTCLGLPGSMPVVNAVAVESAIRIGLALNCEIAEWCRFARKNYFYPDMPKNFQTSQYDEPIAFEGRMDVEVEGETDPDRGLHGLPVHRRHGARQAQTGGARLGVGLRPELGGAAAEHLGGGVQLDVDLETEGRVELRDHVVVRQEVLAHQRAPSRAGARSSRRPPHSRASSASSAAPTR